jgi:hypothetical protein
MPATVDVEGLLDRVCERIARRADARRIAAARRRHADVMAGRETDYLPMIFAAGAPEEAAAWPGFGWDERFYDPAKSLFMQLKEMVLPRVCGESDYVPGVRADLGTINCQTVFGARWRVTGENRSVITHYVPKETLAAWEAPDDVSGLGVMPRVVEHMEHHVDALRRRGLGGVVDVFHCDQQGPFDIAAMTRGHDIFVDLYEDGDFVHHLMRMCVEVYVAATRLCKRIAGEAVGGAGNAVGVWMEAGAVRMCGDSDILVSEAMFREFIQPYHRQALEELGGGWLHYCGGWEGTGRAEGLHLHEAYAEIPLLRGLNWTTGRDWLGEMKKLARLGVVHVGTLPRPRPEPLEAYFRRALSPYGGRSGLLFGAMGEGPWLWEGEEARAMDTWHRVQDEVFA